MSTHQHTSKTSLVRLFPATIMAALFALSACSKHIPSVYEIVGMSLNNSNNTGEKPSDAAADSIPKRAYAIKITLQEVMREKKEGDAQENGFLNEDQLIFLNITSLNDFDNSHPAGSSLNGYFLTRLESSATVEAFVSKGQIGEGKYQDGNYIDNWTSEQYLYLMKPPIISNKQAFVVAIGFSDGRQLKDTIPVKLY